MDKEIVWIIPKYTGSQKFRPVYSLNLSITNKIESWLQNEIKIYYRDTFCMKSEFNDTLPLTYDHIMVNRMKGFINVCK